jgi:predicted nucleotidyltransferase
MVSNIQINNITKAIVNKFNAKKIYLFGSYAAGSAKPDSDLDLCVVTDFQGKRKIDMMREIRREINTYIENSVDILLYEEDEFNARAAVKNTLENSILNHGIILNG